MSLWSRLVQSFPQRSQHPAGLAAPTQPQLLQPPNRPKTLSELEREIEAQAAQATPLYTRPVQRPRRVGHKLVGMALLVGLPIGTLWLVNLPYAPIRRPIARTAPILLLPSYMSMDRNYRQAIALVEQAKQLVDRPTSLADLELGAQKVTEAQARLDALPIGLLDWSLGGHYGWYHGRLTLISFNAARAEVAGLQAQLFQEQNAQTKLLEVQQVIATAKQQYQQATTLVDRQTAAAAWQAALDRLAQIPQSTLAGRTAEQELATGRRDWATAVGAAASTASTATHIQAAQQFAWQAAQSSQNPPHSAAEWSKIEQLWQEAIDRLERVSSDDSVGYAEAQKRMAQYQTNRGEISVRRQAEEKAVRELEQANAQITLLLAVTPDEGVIDRNRTAAHLQEIIHSLEQVPPGTTAYLTAQGLLLKANNKLSELQ